jgi:HEAT repeat protein
MDWLDTNSNAQGGCDVCRPLLTLFVASDELTDAEHELVLQHVAGCAECSAEVTREKELLSMLAAHRSEPDAALLASCRANLEDALDREEEGGWLRRKLGVLLPANWLSPEPVWSAALLVMIGFSVGLFGPRFLQHQKPASHSLLSSPVAALDPSEASSVDVPATSPSELSPLDLHNADVASINVFPADAGAPPQVELHLRARQPVTVQGTVDDDSVKRVLLYILRNNDRFDPDVRLNAVDLLRQRTGDPDVRSALCRSVQTDANAAVRLKALEALNGAEPQDIIRDTLLGALIDDTNPGVRVEAINSLRTMAEKGQLVSDDHIMAVLRDRMQHDPNTYIRLQSAAAIRDLNPGDK